MRDPHTLWTPRRLWEYAKRHWWRHWWEGSPLSCCWIIEAPSHVAEVRSPVRRSVSLGGIISVHTIKNIRNQWALFKWISEQPRGLRAQAASAHVQTRNSVGMWNNYSFAKWSNQGKFKWMLLIALQRQREYFKKASKQQTKCGIPLETSKQPLNNNNNHNVWFKRWRKCKIWIYQFVPKRQ